MWRSGSARTKRGRSNGAWRALAGAGLLGALAAAPARAAEPDPGYWLNFGKTVELCPGAAADSPFKLEGASWGILASGVILCRDRGDSYVLTLDYLNVLIDPVDRDLLKRPLIAFDWFGLALYRRAPGGVDWLYDHSLPVKGELRRDAKGRIAFGRLSFEVPKEPASQATNMLFYLTFDGPLVALHAL